MYQSSGMISDLIAEATVIYMVEQLGEINSKRRLQP